MNRRQFLKVSAGATAAGIVSDHVVAAEQTASPLAGSRPNLILILADDMGFSDIGCFGSEIETPHLDRLASRGIRISQFYNNPRCCPSRASILTGLWSQQAGMGMMVADYKRYPYPGYAGILSAQTLTIPEALKSAGYNTAMVGKWHLAPENEEGKRCWPMQRGFDNFWGMIAGASVYWESPHLFSGNEKLPSPSKDQYLTDLWAEHAAGFVTKLAKDKKPFFLYTAFNAPHWPIQAPETQVEKYSHRYAGGWDQLREERHRKQLMMGVVDARWALTSRDPRVPAWTDAKDKEWEMRRMAVYAAMIERLDQGIGRILDSVEEAGVADNTLIIFMSDNGGNAEEIARGPRQISSGPCEQGMTCAGNVPGVTPGSEDTFQSIGIPWGNCANTPFRLYKHYAQEGGISTPFIACWPRGIKANPHPVQSVGHETDLMPTFLELAGVPYPKSVAAGQLPALAGQSLAPVFAGSNMAHQPIFWEHEGNKALRDGKYKLVSRFPDSWELYDMGADRTELHDLASVQPERTTAMAEQWQQWANRVGVQSWPMPQTPPAEGSGAMPTPPYLRRDAH